MVAERTFLRIQDAYCIALVQKCWEKNRAVILHQLCQEEHVVVLGKVLHICQPPLHLYACS